MRFVFRVSIRIPCSVDLRGFGTHGLTGIYIIMPWLEMRDLDTNFLILVILHRLGFVIVSKLNVPSLYTYFSYSVCA